MFTEIDRLKSTLDTHHPLPPHLVKSLAEDLAIRWTYHSNAIEGNTLTLLETKVVLEGITVGGKALREHFEAINHKEAIDYVNDLCQKGEVLSQWHIKALHSLALKNIDNDNAGRYRTANVIITGANHTPPEHFLLDERMSELMAWYEADEGQHPIERACQLHTDFVIIHPFIDGNGRTARLLLNLELIKHGYPPCVITVDKRLAYYEAIDDWATTGNRHKFLTLIKDCMTESFAVYQKLLGF
ncbi:Protein involved in cell division [Moraxella lacunata]|uniref:Protein involved in cell division n=1 Tax=Moraxella lacunata TaxID=477 RepID=A0A378QLC8_MORLA|nr:Fic family protein [Moraxella lacunata]STZ01501.1 Protein involved in cell division [Moraxella lacunata]